jgi:hypothetical protein
MPITRRKSHKTRTHWIYLLIDPRDNVIRYVGQAVSPKSRFRAHRVCGGGNVSLTLWLIELRDLGMEPEMQLVGKITTYTGHWWIDEQIVNGAERQLIKRLDRMPDGKILNIAFTKRDTLRNGSRRKKSPLTSR